MNKFSPKKLVNSKWTATCPVDKEKHFMVVKVVLDEDQAVVECVLQALMSKREFTIQWRDLEDAEKWSQGWN